MKRVTGIGGIFFKSKNPKALCEWYRNHLGMKVEDWGGVVFKWEEDPSLGKGTTTLSPFNYETNYFEPGKASFMINLRVANLKELLEILRKEGCEVLDKTEESDFGKFGYVIDPEGNNIELWEPPVGM